jgi:hypothetical protein
LCEERAIRKQDTEDDTFDPFEDKDQSTPNHSNFWIAKYIKQLFFDFFFFNNYAATFEYANYTTRNGSRQRTNANEKGIQIWKITDMKIKAMIQIWKIEAKIQIWKIKAKILKQRFKSEKFKQRFV